MNSCHWRRTWACVVVITLAAASIRGANPTSAPADARTISERQASLLLQLSDAEANIKTINQALVRTGYKVGQAYDQIESNQKGNELMDRNGGGPVGWDQFYGKTASSFYYHSSSQTHVDVGRGAAVLDSQSTGSRLTKIDRPKQFDYIYKANNQQIQKAKDQIASLQQNQAALLARRQQHEADQSRLWALLAWEQVRDREIAFKPLYRFQLQPADGAQVKLVRGPILYLRTLDKALSEALDSISTDQAGTFTTLQQRVKSAYGALQGSMADTLLAADLKPEERKEGEAIKALCKQAADECTIIVENYGKAMESDRAKEDSSKLAFRGQLQTSLAHLGATAQELDDRLTKAAEAWHVTPAPGTETPDKLPVWGKAQLGAPVVSAAPAGTVDLLKLVDPARDSVKGQWSIKDGHLTCNQGKVAVLRFPYRPPEEYDYTVEFAAAPAEEGFALVMAKGDKTLGLSIDGSKGKGTHFIWLGKDAGEKLNVKFLLQNGRRHVCRIEVRNDGVKAFMDDELLSSYPTDYHEFYAPPISLGDPGTVGLIAWWNKVTVDRAEITERGHAGTALREAK